MNRILVLLTKEFPYGKAESFLETEVEFFDGFDKVILCPLFASGLDHQNPRFNRFDEKIIVLPSRNPLSIIEKLLGISISFMSKAFWHECRKVLLNSNDKLSSFIELLSFSYTGTIISRYTKKSLLKWINNEDSITVYAYWLHQQAFVASYLKQKIPNVVKGVSRCHRFDIYEYSNNNYIPYRDLLFDSLDYIICISDDGKEYLHKKYNCYSEKYVVSRLGTLDRLKEEYTADPITFRILSCSNCVEVKRIDKIIMALSMFEKDNVNIVWTHYGDGVLFDSLVNLAKSKLINNVRYIFKGFVPNDVMLKELAINNYDLFVNVSSSEGIPVSIMEAMSFGIPTVATDVGGTKELVKDGVNGIILNPNFDIKDLYEAIRQIQLMDSNTYIELRNRARLTWEDKYNARNNYNEYTRFLLE